MITDTSVMPEGETVLVDGYPLTLVRRDGNLLQTFVLDKTDAGQPRLRMGTQPMASSAERITLSQTMLLPPELLAELATAAVSLKSELDAANLAADPPAPNDIGS